MGLLDRLRGKREQSDLRPLFSLAWGVYGSAHYSAELLFQEGLGMRKGDEKTHSKWWPVVLCYLVFYLHLVEREAYRLNTDRTPTIMSGLLEQVMLPLTYEEDQPRFGGHPVEDYIELQRLLESETRRYRERYLGQRDLPSVDSSLHHELAVLLSSICEVDQSAQAQFAATCQFISTSFGSFDSIDVLSHLKQLT